MVKNLFGIGEQDKITTSVFHDDRFNIKNVAGP
jgi:hypothetical protein